MKTDGYIKLDGDHIAVECRRLIAFFTVKNDEAFEAYKFAYEAGAARYAREVEAEKADLYAYRDTGKAYRDFIHVRDKHSHPCKVVKDPWYLFRVSRVEESRIYDWEQIRKDLVAAYPQFWHHTDYHELRTWNEADVMKWDWFASNVVVRPKNTDRPLYRGMFHDPYDLTVLRELDKVTGDLYLSIGDYNTLKRFQQLEQELKASDGKA